MCYGNWKHIIRKLSDGNRVIKSQTTFCVMGPTIFELWVMKTKIWVMEIDEPNAPLSSYVCMVFELWLYSWRILFL